MQKHMNLLKMLKQIKIICYNYFLIIIFNLQINLVNLIYHMMMFILKKVMPLLKVLVE